MPLARRGASRGFIQVSGELDLATPGQLEHAFREALGSARLVLLDMHEVTFMDSTGLHAMMNAKGDLDLSAEPRLASLLGRCTTHAALVIVDLSAVEFLSCGALRLILSASRRTRARSGRFVVVRGQTTVQRLFDLYGVDLEFELVDAPPACIHPPRSWAPAG